MRCAWICRPRSRFRRIARPDQKGGECVGEKIAFIGVGRMGSGMVARLMAAGHELTLFDPNDQATAPFRERGAQVASSIAAAAARTSVVMASVPGPADARAAAAAIAEAGGARLFVALSTSGPAAAQAHGNIRGPARDAAI